MHIPSWDESDEFEDRLGESLKEDQIGKLVAYIRSLARSPGESTWKPYLAGDPQNCRIVARSQYDANNRTATVAPCRRRRSLVGTTRSWRLTPS